MPVLESELGGIAKGCPERSGLCGDDGSPTAGHFASEKCKERKSNT